MTDESYNKSISWNFSFPMLTENKISEFNQLFFICRTEVDCKTQMIKKTNWWCCLNEKCPLWLICLNTQSPVGESVIWRCDDVGGGTSLKVGFEVSVATPFSVNSHCCANGSTCELSAPTLLPCLLFCSLPQ